MDIKLTFSIIAVVALAACAPMQQVPQTEAGFRNSSSPETLEVNRDYGTVVAALEREAVSCFNKEIRSRVRQGYRMWEGKVTYRSSLKPKGPNKSELMIQVEMNSANGASQPEGGFYLLVADVGELPGGRSRAAIYGSPEGLYGDIYRSTKAWIEGSNADCPELPGE